MLRLDVRDQTSCGSLLGVRFPSRWMPFGPHGKNEMILSKVIVPEPTHTIAVLRWSTQLGFAAEYDKVESIFCSRSDDQVECHGISRGLVPW